MKRNKWHFQIHQGYINLLSSLGCSALNLSEWQLEKETSSRLLVSRILDVVEMGNFLVSWKSRMLSTQEVLGLLNMEMGRKHLENSYRFPSSWEGKTDWETNLSESKYEIMKFTVFRREKGIRAKQNSQHKEVRLPWLGDLPTSHMKRKHRKSKKPSQITMKKYERIAQTHSGGGEGRRGKTKAQNMMQLTRMARKKLHYQ